MSDENKKFIFKTSVVTSSILLILFFVYVIFVLILPISFKIIFENFINKQVTNIEKKIPDYSSSSEDMKKRLIIRYLINEIEPYSDEFKPLIKNFENTTKDNK